MIPAEERESQGADPELSSLHVRGKHSTETLSAEEERIHPENVLLVMFRLCCPPARVCSVGLKAVEVEG